MADAKNEQASIAIAIGAVSIPITIPAIVGPATWAVEALAWSLVFPSTSCSLLTRDGRKDW